MKQRIKSLSVFQTGKILSIVYGLLSLVMLPFMMIPVLSRGEGGMASLLFVTFLYPIAGFIGGSMMAAFYNVAASLVGGLVVTFEPYEFD